MYNIIGKIKYWVSISAALVVASIVLWFVWGLQLGIDFTGGTAMQISFAGDLPSSDQVQAVVSDAGIANSRIQVAGSNGYVLKMQAIDNDQRQQILDQFADQQVSEDSFNTIGPALGDELKSKAIIALLLVILAIVAFVSYSFRTITHASVPSWVFGAAAIVALVHDTVLMVGAFILLGHFYDVQIDSYFVTAALTVLGFSVNDTIVVFDRIRENLKHRGKKTFAEIINSSINSTLARSLNTSLTALLVLFALFLFGGDGVHYLVLALILGITFGTYSSIFIASPLLLLGEKLLKRK